MLAPRIWEILGARQNVWVPEEVKVARKLVARVGRDLRHLRNIDAYAVTALVLSFAVISIFNDELAEGPRWAVLFAGVGILVYRVTLPDRASHLAGEVLHDRTSLDDTPFSSRLDNAREVWIFAPSAVNLLSQQHCQALRTKILTRHDGLVRVVVLDPTQQAALDLATRQLDDSTDFPLQGLGHSLETTLERLSLMNRWAVAGTLRCKLLGFNPGFSLVAIDPDTSHGTIIVEFHAFHNEATMSRMHVELTRTSSPRWYAYWSDQFRHIWHAGRPLA